MCKKRMVMFGSIVAMVLAGVVGCGGVSDYTEYFSVTNVAPYEDAKENLLQIDYVVSNQGKNDNLSFAVTIDGQKGEYGVAAGSSKSDSAIIDIGKPEEYQISYDVLYEVSKNGKVVWSKEDEISYDCTEMFVHPATIYYGEESKEVELVDYQSNYFDLEELFSGYDVNQTHSVKLENAGADRAYIQTTETAEGGKSTLANGSVLHLFTFGNEEINDTSHYSDGLEIYVKEAVPASSVNWSDYMEFIKEAKTSTSTVGGMNVTTMQLYVEIENPSDEDVSATVTEFYVNDTAMSPYSLVGSTNSSIYAGETDQVYTITSAPVIQQAGIRSMDKMGMEVELKDSSDHVVFKDVVWLYLE